MRIAPVTIISAGDMSAASVTSTALDINQAYSFSIQAAWTGSTPVGTLQIQGSNDIVASISNVTNWSNVGGTAGTAAVSGNAGSAMLEIPVAEYHYVRVVYTKTSGTGTINATFFSKGV